MNNPADASLARREHPPCRPTCPQDPRALESGMSNWASADLAAAATALAGGVVDVFGEARVGRVETELPQSRPASPPPAARLLFGWLHGRPPARDPRASSSTARLARPDAPLTLWPTIAPSWPGTVGRSLPHQEAVWQSGPEPVWPDGRWTGWCFLPQVASLLKYGSLSAHAARGRRDDRVGLR
jgi:hypothetical protein